MKKQKSIKIIMFDNRAADIKNTKLLQLEVKVKKRKNKCFMCLCSPLKKSKMKKV